MTADEAFSSTHSPTAVEGGRAGVYISTRQEHSSHSTATGGTAGMRWDSSLDCGASIDGYKLCRKDRMGRQGWDSGCPVCEGEDQIYGLLVWD